MPSSASTFPLQILRAALTAGALLALLWAVASLDRPLGQDQGIWIWAADTIRAGGIPHRDFWDTKGILTYYPIALLRLVLGPTDLAFRVVDLVLVGIGGAIVAGLARRVGGPGPVAALLWLLWYADYDYDDTAQVDGWVGIALAGVALLLSATKIAVERRLFAAGLVLGCAILVKPLYGLAALMALPVLVPLVRTDWVKGVRAAAAGLAGGAVPLVAALVWLVISGGLAATWDAHIAYTASVYAGQAGLLDRARALGADFADSPSLVAALVLALFGWFVNRRSPPAASLGLLLVSLTAVIGFQNKYYPYHHLPLLLPAAALGAAGAARLVELAARAGRGLLGSAAAAAAGTVVAVVLAGPALQRIPVDLLVTLDARLHPERARGYDALRYGFYGPRQSPLNRLAAYVRGSSAPGDRVLVWSMRANLYGVSGRLPPTRFGMSMALIAGAGTEFRDRYRREFLADVARTPPVLIVARSPALCSGPSRIELECLDAFPELERVVARDYEKSREIDEFTVWRRKPRSDTAPVRTIPEAT